VKVIKIGGGCLSNKETIAAILDLLAQRGRGNIVVVSALGGVTDLLLDGMRRALADEEAIGELMSRLKNRHMLVAGHVIPGDKQRRAFSLELGKMLGKLERLYYGLHFTREITPRMADSISSFGERMCAHLLRTALQAREGRACCRFPEEIGILTDGKYADATAQLDRSEKAFKDKLQSMHNGQRVLFIPGFYGVSESGEITTFGRGGSDYSAAVVTAISGAEGLEIWKDVDGFLSADPKFISDATLIPELSYDEAAELAYFGAKILHPRTVEPLRDKGLSIEIRNTLHPDVTGSRITAQGETSFGVVKSVAHTTDISILKVHASGVGMRRGILSEVATAVAGQGVNIKSVVTSQTCISLLLARKDLGPATQALQNLHPRPYSSLEMTEDIALVAVVGKGLAEKPGIAAGCFSAAAACQVNIEMIAFGPSPVALYFIVQQGDLRTAVAAIHNHFFQPSQGCAG
jgi:aspartate kinase